MLKAEDAYLSGTEKLGQYEACDLQQYNDQIKQLVTLFEPW